MSRITFQRGKFSCAADLSRSHSIAIDLNFDGPQPNHFGTPSATALPLRVGDFVGSVRQGGSCNVSQIRLIPHCNGTHTESVSHIVDAMIPICEIAPRGLGLALLVSTATMRLSQSSEFYPPPAQPDDLVIAADAIVAALRSWQHVDIDALVIRTWPNHEGKRVRDYSVQAPAYLTSNCMQAISDSSIEHLLIDLPSVDRMYDNGLLSNHHLFWNVAPKSRNLDSETRRERTITEMIYVPDDLPDGLHLLSLQVAPFVSDAAPSRPILFPLAQ